MKRKKIIADIKIKLNDLKKDDSLKYESLNQYSEYLNKAKSNLNLEHFENVVLLSDGESNYSKTPTNIESAKRNELINKYSEALTEINPNYGNNILQEFKQSSSIFKLVNIGFIISAGILFFAIGKEFSNQNTIPVKSHEKQIDSLKALVGNQNDKIEKQDFKIDSLIQAPIEIDVSEMFPKSAIGGKVFINAEKTFNDKTILSFKGTNGISVNEDGKFDKNQIEVGKGDRFYLKYKEELWIVNVLSTTLGADLEIVKE